MRSLRLLCAVLAVIASIVVLAPPAAALSCRGEAVNTSGSTPEAYLRAGAGGMVALLESVWSPDVDPAWEGHPGSLRVIVSFGSAPPGPVLTAGEVIGWGWAPAQWRVGTYFFFPEQDRRCPPSPVGFTEPERIGALIELADARGISVHRITPVEQSATGSDDVTGVLVVLAAALLLGLAIGARISRARDLVTER